MTQHLRQTVRSFLRCERPATPEEARLVLDEWFGRYRPDPALLDQEVVNAATARLLVVLERWITTDA